MRTIELVARTLCVKAGMDPDLSLGGDGQNFLWHEYVYPARGVLEALTTIPDDLRELVHVRTWKTGLEKILSAPDWEDESKEALPCVACGKELKSFGSNETNHPLGGVGFETTGHYGSGFFDPMDGSVLEISVCDHCLTKNRNRTNVREGKPRVTA
jgi:hypothetical protein